MSNVQFERPPVNHVHLTLHFEVDAELQVSHLSSLRESWRATYPRTRERPPIPRDDSDAVKVMGRHTSWPFPYLTFHSDDRSIIVESTKFALTWTFGDDAPEYPTYAILRGELAERFAEFVATVTSEVGQEPRITAAECQYYNELKGESLGRVIGYVLTDGNVDLADQADVADVDYQGFRRHIAPTEASDMVDVLVGVEMSLEEEDTVDFFIEATHQAGDDEHELGGIDLAHEVLISTFLRWTRPDQHERWGRSEDN